MNNILILEDTRQAERKHELKHQYFRSVGIHWNRTALYCGDYTLPADQSISVDTKKDIQELIGDIQVKQMAKRDVHDEIYKIFEEKHISFDIAESMYHAICDDDKDRFAEREINELCFKNNIPERVISDLQTLYVKRHGFFHRGLKRAQNSGIKLYILVANEEHVRDIRDLFEWVNPRLKIMKNSNKAIGFYRNGRPRYEKIQKHPRAMAGNTLAKACLTMQAKYGCEFMFCTPQHQGKKILELLKVEV